jgi:hypothetical protein
MTTTRITSYVSAHAFAFEADLFFAREIMSAPFSGLMAARSVKEVRLFRPLNRTEACRVLRRCAASQDVPFRKSN